MERTKEGPFRVEEWTIENFGCWSKENHQALISTSQSHIFPDFSIDLFPKGVNGHEERMMVHLRCSQPMVFIGQLTFRGPDGTDFCTQQVDSQEERTSVAVSGPKFREVIDLIRKQEDSHGDKLVLKCATRRHTDTIEYRRTRIQAFEFAFKLFPNIVDDLDATLKCVSSFTYPLDQGGVGLVQFEIGIVRSKLVLSLQSKKSRRPIAARTRMSVVSKGASRSEENAHLFRDGVRWTFSDTLTAEEVKKEGCQVVVTFKIVPTTRYKQCIGSHLCWNLENISFVTSSPSYRPPLPTAAAATTTTTCLDGLAEDLSSLYRNQELTDFELNCGNLTFPVHKNVLVARSPFFRDLLIGDATCCSADVEDVDAPTLGRFLTFLYCGALEKDVRFDGAFKLYHAAAKYEVPTLKAECVKLLEAHISVSNASDVLSLSGRHKDERLRAMAQDFILKNLDEVSSSDEWKNLLRNEPLLVAETLNYFVAKKFVGCT